MSMSRQDSSSELDRSESTLGSKRSSAEADIDANGNSNSSNNGAVAVAVAGNDTSSSSSNSGSSSTSIISFSSVSSSSSSSSGGGGGGGSAKSSKNNSNSSHSSGRLSLSITNPENDRASLSMDSNMSTWSAEDKQRLQDADETLKMDEDKASNYDIRQELQRGGYGIVHLAIRKSDRKLVALKFFGYTENQPSEEAIDKEILLMEKTINIDGFVKLFSTFPDTLYGCLPNKKFIKTYRVIVMELLEGRDLYDGVLLKNPTHSEIITVFKKFIFALKNLHDNGLIHRDIKCENIMKVSRSLDSDVRIIDYGFMVSLNGKDVYDDPSIVGTRGFLAPETKRRNIYSRKTDIFQAGIVLFYLLFAQKLNRQYEETLYKKFHDANGQKFENAEGLYILDQKQYFNHIFPFNQRDFLPKWQNLSADGRDLLFKMLEREPKKRASAEEILAHPFLNPIQVMDLPPSGLLVRTSTISTDIKRFVIYQKLKREFQTRKASKLQRHESNHDIAQYYFEKFDSNHDGKIEKVELQKGIFNLLNEAALNHSSPSESSSSSSMATDSSGRLHQVDDIFEHIDSDGSGSISIDELKAFIVSLLEEK